MKRILTLLLMTVMIVSISAVAAEPTNIILNTDGFIDLDGSANSGAKVSVTVIKTDRKNVRDDKEVWLNKNTEIVYADADTVNETGKYHFGFALTESGIYYAYINEGAENKYKVLEIDFTSKANNEIAVERIKNIIKSQTASELETELKNSRFDLGLFGDEYESADLSAAAQMIFDELKNESELTSEIITKTAVKAFVIDMFNNAKVTDIGKYRNALYLDDTKPIADNYNSNYDGRLLDALTANKIKSIDEYDSVIKNTVIEYTAKLSGSVDDVKKLLTDMAEYMGITKTNMITNDSVRTIASDSKIQTVKDIAAYINGLNQYEPSNRPTTGGGGGGGSRGNVSISSGISYDEDKKDDGDTKEQSVFNDIDIVPWAKDAIESLYKSRIINGKEKGYFCPNDSVTREEFVKMVVGAFRLNLVFEDNKDVFSDVTPNDWFYQSVMCAYSGGIIKGISESEFGSGLNISRQDLAVMVYNAAKACSIDIPTDKQKTEFIDGGNISDYAKEAVERLQLSGIISGYEDGSFKPQGNADRAEAAKIIHSLMQYIK